jgi:hypothetical protein
MATYLLLVLRLGMRETVFKFFLISSWSDAKLKRGTTSPFPPLPKRDILKYNSETYAMCRLIIYHIRLIF